MKRISWLLLMFIAWTIGLAFEATAQGRFQVCDGVLKRDDYKTLSLDTGPSPSSNWCFADFDADDVARTVLGVCQIGDRCHVEGYFGGHGVFEWLRLTKVENLSRRMATARIYTPAAGQRERKNIMDAIRLAWCPDTVFAVQALVVARQGDKAIAAATIEDSTHQKNCGTTVVLEGLNEQWRAEYNYGGDGARSCKDALAIQREIMEKLSAFGVGPAFLPGNFIPLMNEAEKSPSDDDADCAVTDRF